VNYKILIIGFGSIGKRHFEILMGIGISQIAILSRRKLDSINLGTQSLFNSIDDAFTTFSPTHVIVANETSRHLSIILELQNYIINYDFDIYLEKPIGLIEDLIAFKNLSPKLKERIKVGFDLRFDLGIIYLRELISKCTFGKILHVNIEVGQDLTQWRPDRDYTQTMSSKKSLGGGVLYDLSHELDITTLFFGPSTYVSSMIYNTNTFNIDTDDVAKILFFSRTNVLVSISLDYHQKNISRYIKIIFEKNDLYLDLVKKQIFIDKNVLYDYSFQMRNDRLKQCLLDFISGKSNYLCSFEEGIKNLELIKFATDNNILNL
jgi:predicted dehydrogenase